MVPVNSVVADVGRLGDVPIRSDGTRTVFVRDIGTIADSADIEVGYALVNGRRTVYIPVTKRADASTLSVVNLVKENIPKFQAVLPPGVKVSYEFDQSPFVVRAILGLAEEGLLGAGLTGLMILLPARLAQRSGRGGEHPVGDPGSDDSTLGVRADGQPDDPWRIGFGGRHPGR
jgi:multidrug efflux pump subunit AcrB